MPMRDVWTMRDFGGNPCAGRVEIRLHRLLGMLASAGLTRHRGEPLLLGSLATHPPPP
jgi:hypothetical protein